MLDPVTETAAPEKLATLAIDLTEFAREHTGPLSWSAHPDAESLAAWALADHDAALGAPAWDVDVSSEDVPRERPGAPERAKASLTHRERFVLAAVDGVSALGVMVDVLGLATDEVLRAVDKLIAIGLVELDRSRRRAMR